MNPKFIEAKWQISRFGEQRVAY